MVKSVRVVEVIPGRPTVGIEIPNPHRAMIRLREVIDSDRYQHEASALTVALGQDIGGAAVVANLARCRTCWWPGPPDRASRWGSMPC